MSSSIIQAFIVALSDYIAYRRNAAKKFNSFVIGSDSNIVDAYTLTFDQVSLSVEVFKDNTIARINGDVVFEQALRDTSRLDYLFQRKYDLFATISEEVLVEHTAILIEKSYNKSRNNNSGRHQVRGRSRQNTSGRPLSKPRSNIDRVKILTKSNEATIDWTED